MDHYSTEQPIKQNDQILHKYATVSITTRFTFIIFYTMYYLLKKYFLTKYSGEKLLTGQVNSVYSYLP